MNKQKPERPNMTNRLLPGFIYKNDVEKREYLVSNSVDSYNEVELFHPIFGCVYLYALLPVLSRLDFVSSAYIAQNGLLRLNIKGRRPNVFEDISLRPDHEKLFLMRDYREAEFKEMEDKVIKVVEDHTQAVIGSIEDISDIFG